VADDMDRLYLQHQKGIGFCSLDKTMNLVGIDQAKISSLEILNRFATGKHQVPAKNQDQLKLAMPMASPVTYGNEKGFEGQRSLVTDKLIADIGKIVLLPHMDRIPCIARKSTTGRKNAMESR
jgi:hypothetical protein